MFELPIECIASLQFVGEQRMVFAKHEPVRRGRWRRLTREVFEPPEMRRAHRIALIVRPLYAGTFRNERRCDDLTPVAPRPQRPLQHVPSATRLITHAQLAISRRAVE